MKKIPEERKEGILAKLVGPHRKPVAVVAAEEGVSTATVYNWRKQARREGQPPSRRRSQSGGLVCLDKL